MGVWVSQPIWDAHVVFIYSHMKGDEQPKTVLPTNRNIYHTAVMTAKTLKISKKLTTPFSKPF